MTTLHVRRQVELHVVAQVVEAEFVVRAVGDVGAVGDLPLGVVEVVLDHADRHAQEAVDPAHPLGVATGEVVVDRDHVHALALERVQIRRQRRHERLAFAGLHFGDAPIVEHHAADELDVEVPHVHHTLAGFAHHGKGFGQDLVERLAVGHPLTELVRLGLQLGIGQRSDAGFERIDARHDRPQPLEFTVVLGADDFREELVDHV